jgi:tRNA-2-methylthio-N6-dimethylallyladenosine synthase
LRRIDIIKNAKRRYALTTDIIVGFPGETEQDFAETIALVEACQFDSLYIFKYSERSRTPAAKLSDNVSEADKTARFRALEKLQEEVQRKIFAGYLGEKLSVLVEGTSAKSVNDLTGHSTCHKVLNFPGPGELKGQICSVVVSEAKAHSLYGRLEITA